jgi:hypothetical protein
MILGGGLRASLGRLNPRRLMMRVVNDGGLLTADGRPNRIDADVIDGVVTRAWRPMDWGVWTGRLI